MHHSVGNSGGASRAVYYVYLTVGAVTYGRRKCKRFPYGSRLRYGRRYQGMRILRRAALAQDDRGITGLRTKMHHPVGNSCGRLKSLPCRA